jgi:hypothetical protein
MKLINSRDLFSSYKITIQPLRKKESLNHHLVIFCPCFLKKENLSCHQLRLKMLQGSLELRNCLKELLKPNFYQKLLLPLIRVARLHLPAKEKMRRKEEKKRKFSQLSMSKR